jgi:transcription elongation factor Elf1
MNLEKYEEFACPYCSQTNSLSLDITGGRKQRLVVDCEVCCAPIVIRLTLDEGEILSMDVQRENE